MKTLDPDLLLRAYSIGVFPMSDSRDAQRPLLGRAAAPGDHSARRLPSLEVAAQDAAVGSLRGHPRPRLRARSSGSAPSARTPGSTPRSRRATSACTRPATPIRSRSGASGGLVGGLYGVRLGAAFFGEVMFSLARDASKVALAWLVARLIVGGFQPARLPVHDRASAEPRRGRDRPEGLSGAVGVGARRGLGGAAAARPAPAAPRPAPVEFEALDRLLAAPARGRRRRAAVRDGSSRSSWARRRRSGARRR